MSASEIISYEPATGAAYWRGPIGDVDAEISTARAHWPDWASKPITFRIEAMRRFANVIRSKHEDLADCIARETGKPLWEARTEVEAVINKVEVSIASYNERTSQRRLEGNMGAKTAIRHKPHGVLGVLGPYNFPAHLPNGHIIPALIAGNAVIFKPSEKTPATGAMLVDCYRMAGIPNGVIRLLIGGPAEGKALATHPDIDGILFTGAARRRRPACRVTRSVQRRQRLHPTNPRQLRLALLPPPYFRITDGVPCRMARPVAGRRHFPECARRRPHASENACLRTSCRLGSVDRWSSKCLTRSPYR